MKRAIWIWMFLTLSLVCGVLYWVGTHAYVDISVEAAGNEKLSITLTDQNNGSNQVVAPDSKRIKKLVRRGTYEVTTSQNNSHAFNVVGVGGFLSTVQVRQNLTSEKSRVFMGGKPASCIGSADGLAYSLACGDSVGNLQFHMPATPSQPTYNKKLPTALEGYIQGTIITSEGSFALLKAPSNSEDQGPPHGLYKLDQNGVSLVTALRDLDDTAYYSIKPHKQGFLIYNFSIGHFFYYSSAKSTPEQLPIAKFDNDLTFYSLDSTGNEIVIAYSTIKGEEPIESYQADGLKTHSDLVEKEQTSEKPRSTVQVLQGSEYKKFEFDYAPKRIRLCGDYKLCVLKQDGLLNIYEYSGDKIKTTSKLVNVSSITFFESQLLVVKPGGIVHFDIDNNRGNFLYTFGEYAYCGLSNMLTSWQLCVEGKNNSRNILSLSKTKDDSDSIDKKVYELTKSKFVQSVAAYGTIIFISPAVGEMQLQEATGRIGYDPAAKRAAAEAIDAEIKRIGFDTVAYKLINPFR